MTTTTRNEKVNGQQKVVTTHEYECGSQAELIRVRTLLEALGGWSLTRIGEWSQDHGETMTRVTLSAGWAGEKR